MTQRVALVTGAMGGLGTAICQELAKAGHKVVASYHPQFDNKDAWLADMAAAALVVVQSPEQSVFHLLPLRVMLDAVGVRVDALILRVADDGHANDDAADAAAIEQALQLAEKVSHLRGVVRVKPFGSFVVGV